jgi:hypothetical protein
LGKTIVRAIIENEYLMSLRLNEIKLNYLDVDNVNECLYASLLPIGIPLRKRSLRVRLVNERFDAVDERVCEK